MYQKEAINFQKNASISPYLIGEGCSKGTFGELLQGALENDGKNFLVTLPISTEAKAYFSPSLETNEINVLPVRKTKSKKLASLLIKDLNLNCGGFLSPENPLPEGKGLASSSADLVATGRAIFNAFNLPEDTHILQRNMALIEPSDGVMYDESVAFFHQAVKLHRILGPLPKLVIIAIDEGGIIDTITHNRTKFRYQKPEISEYKYLLNKITEAIKNSDLPSLGKVTTRSAILNQHKLPKRNLELLIKLCNKTEGLGVVTCHSGTYSGILLNPNEKKYCQKLNTILGELNQLDHEPFIFFSA